MQNAQPRSVIVLGGTPHDHLAGDVIRQAIDGHLARHGIERPLNVQVNIEPVTAHFGACRIRLHLQVHAHDRVIDRTISKSRSPQGAGGVAAGGGGLLGVILGLAITAVSSAASNSDPIDVKFEECLRETVGEVLLAIDRACGATESPLTQRWRRLMWLRLVIPVTLFAIGFPLSLAVYGTKHWGLLLGVELFQCATLMAILHLLVLIITPTAFYASEPAGQRAFARIGIRGVVAMRLVLGFALVLILMVWLCAGSFFIDPSSPLRKPD